MSRLRGKTEFYKHKLPRMSLENKLRYLCRKVCYDSKSRAKSAIKRTIASPFCKPDSDALRPYLCKLCGYYHIGHDRYVAIETSSGSISSARG